MTAVIVSDLHLGSRHCRADELWTFLLSLPPDAALVLNGDVVDRRADTRLSGRPAEIMRWLEAESTRRRVIWLRGNHDRRHHRKGLANIEFDRFLPFGKRLLVTHGDAFEHILRYGRPLTGVIRAAYWCIGRLGGPRVDVAVYAKRWWKSLYEVIRRHLIFMAVRHARRHGYAAVLCGHSHYPEDSMIQGVRYLNTGAWTESPVYAVWVTDDDIRFARADARDEKREEAQKLKIGASEDRKCVERRVDGSCA